jgi:poly(A) polymerase
MAREILADLRYPNAVIDTVALLVETHMQLHGYHDDWTDGAVRRLMVRLNSAFPAALQLVRADAAGHDLTGRSTSSRKFDNLERRLESLHAEPPELLDSPLTGDDLMARFGRPPGPWIREIKSALRDEVLDGHLAPEDREKAWKVAEALVSNQKAE